MTSLISTASSLSLVDGKPFTPGFSAVPVVLFALNKSPVPSSMIVATPVTGRLLRAVAIKLKVSPESLVMSLKIAARTNNVPLLGICA